MKPLTSTKAQIENEVNPKMTRKRKGVSPIVSVILLILIAVAATVILFSWFSGTAGQNPTNEPALQERIKIDGVQVTDDGSNYDITVYVRNIGEVSVSLSTLYIINATSGSVVGQTSVTGTIGPGDTTSVSINDVFANSVTGVFIAKVVTTNGVEATYTFSIG